MLPLRKLALVSNEGVPLQLLISFNQVLSIPSKCYSRSAVYFTRQIEADLSLVNQTLILQSFNEGSAITIFFWGQSKYSILFYKILLVFNVQELEPAIQTILIFVETNCVLHDDTCKYRVSLLKKRLKEKVENTEIIVWPWLTTVAFGESNLLYGLVQQLSQSTLVTLMWLDEVSNHR